MAINPVTGQQMTAAQTEAYSQQQSAKYVASGGVLGGSVGGTASYATSIGVQIKSDTETGQAQAEQKKQLGLSNSLTDPLRGAIPVYSKGSLVGYKTPSGNYITRALAGEVGIYKIAESEAQRVYASQEREIAQLQTAAKSISLGSQPRVPSQGFTVQYAQPSTMQQQAQQTQQPQIKPQGVSFALFGQKPGMPSDLNLIKRANVQQKGVLFQGQSIIRPLSKTQAFGEKVKNIYQRTFGLRALRETTEGLMDSTINVPFEKVSKTAYGVGFKTPQPVMERVPTHATSTYKEPTFEQKPLELQQNIRLGELSGQTQKDMEKFQTTQLETAQKDVSSYTNKLQEQVNKEEISLEEAQLKLDKYISEKDTLYKETVNKYQEGKIKLYESQAKDIQKDIAKKAEMKGLPGTFAVTAGLGAASLIPGVGVAIAGLTTAYVATHPKETLKSIKEQPLSFAVGFAGGVAGGAIAGGIKAPFKARAIERDIQSQVARMVDISKITKGTGTLKDFTVTDTQLTGALKGTRTGTDYFIKATGETLSTEKFFISDSFAKIAKVEVGTEMPKIQKNVFGLPKELPTELKPNVKVTMVGQAGAFEYGVPLGKSRGLVGAVSEGTKKGKGFGYGAIFESRTSMAGENLLKKGTLFREGIAKFSKGGIAEIELPKKFNVMESAGRKSVFTFENELTGTKIDVGIGASRRLGIPSMKQLLKEQRLPKERARALKPFSRKRLISDTKNLFSSTSKQLKKTQKLFDSLKLDKRGRMNLMPSFRQFKQLTRQISELQKPSPDFGKQIIDSISRPISKVIAARETSGLMRESILKGSFGFKPFVTGRMEIKTKGRSLFNNLGISGIETKGGLRQRQQSVITFIEPSTSLKNELRIGTVPSIGIKSLERQELGLKTLQLQQQRLKTPFMPFNPLVIPPIIGKPFAFPKTFNLNFPEGIGGIRKRKQKLKYTPSLIAVTFDIYGKKPKKNLTGLSLRPMLKSTMQKSSLMKNLGF